MMNISKYLALALSIQASGALFAGEPSLKTAIERDNIQKETEAQELILTLTAAANVFRQQYHIRESKRVTLQITGSQYRLLSADHLESLKEQNITIENKSSIVYVHE